MDLAITQLGGILLDSHEGGRNIHDQRVRTVDLFKLGCLFCTRPWVIEAVLTEVNCTHALKVDDATCLERIPWL